MEVFPVTEKRREIISTSSASNSNSSRIFFIPLFPLTSNSAVTEHSSAPFLTKERSGFAPSTKFNASMITDLPEPVSPDMTFNPSAKDICASSISAKFLTVSISIIKASSTFLLFFPHRQAFSKQQARYRLPQRCRESPLC